MDHFSISITTVEYGILGRRFTITGQITHADMTMNPIYFGSDPADIRIRINPRIRNESLIRFWPWRNLSSLRAPVVYCDIR